MDKGKEGGGNNQSDCSMDSTVITGESYKGFPSGWWGFTRTPIAHSLTRLPEAEEPVAIQMFGSILAWAGLATAGTTQTVEGGGGADEHVAIAQALLEKCLRSESLLAELYMQLIKQVYIIEILNINVYLSIYLLV